MLNIFRKQKLLNSEDEHFQIECYSWLLRHFGGVDFYHHTTLVLPTREHFPEPVSSHDEVAVTTFQQVMTYCNMQDWPVTLVAQEREPNSIVGESLLVQNVPRSPQGTFSVNEHNEVTISYNPELVSNPVSLVATYAHELAHYLTATAPQAPPGGWENWEFATDIAATFLGFGVFMANSAFSFHQFSGNGSSGWQASRAGYLSEAEHSYALAIFLRLKGIEPTKAIPHCDRNIRSYLKKALSELDKSDVIERLKAIEPSKSMR